MHKRGAQSLTCKGRWVGLSRPGGVFALHLQFSTMSLRASDRRHWRGNPRPFAVHSQSFLAIAEFHRTKGPCVVEKSVNFVSAFGAKSSVHSLSPPFPTEPTSLGFGGDPF